ncbi:MAG: PAS domain-containing sensor histidine kinase, partial [Asticcacaulis sp.]|nr:PAS domain-containing sensor histidine kinase [Asticcacaulis sp.]
VTIEKSVDKRLERLDGQVSHVTDQRNNFIYILIIGTVLGVGILLAGTVLIIRLEVEKEKVEDENQRAESRFLAVMNGVNDGIYELNFVNDTMYMSKEFKAMLGFDEDGIEDTAAAVIGLIHPDDVEKSLEVRRDYITKKTPHYVNVFRMKHKDGTWRWILSRGVGTWDRFGQIRSLIGTHTDITEQKAREEELRQLNDDMEAFTYITSHDMRSPLVNLKGFSHELALAVKDVNDLLETKQDKVGPATWARLEAILKHDIPEALGFIGNAVDRMDTLTTAILDLSRIGKYVYHDEWVNTREIFDKCLGAQSYEISSKHVEVTVGSLPDLVADRMALEQIFSNLLDNAVKYLRPDTPGHIDIACEDSGRDHIFSIRDNGRGIAPEDSDRVFNIFRRARNTGDVRGLGIGMAFVKASLRKMGGTIWFESTLGQGTTFYVSVPRKSLERTAAPLPAARAAGQGARS